MLTRLGRLDAAPVRETIVRLAQRISERFPNSGLSKVAHELIAVADENEKTLRMQAHPIWWLRLLTVFGISALVGVLGWALVVGVKVSAEGRIGLTELVQGVESAINDLIFLSIAIYFLTSLEGRHKRKKTLRMLHRLRSLAHIVDMHQLTKDPEHVIHDVTRTASSPVRTLSRPDLSRYLEYCSELLSLLSKLAALHDEFSQDELILDAVNDLENLTTGLCGKIGQKIAILAEVEERGAVKLGAIAAP